MPVEVFDLRRTWYLPEKLVSSGMPQRKDISLVTDPDLLTPLLSVMFLYRERQVVVPADIKENILQKLILEQDLYAMLFPYTYRDSSGRSMVTMVFNNAVFGVTSQFTHSLSRTSMSLNKKRSLQEDLQQ